MSLSLTLALAPLLAGSDARACKAAWDDTTAIREMFFSVERMEEHARSLARAQRIKPHSQLGTRCSTGSRTTKRA